MSLKELIDVRYNLPGYTVLLVVVGLILPHLIDYLDTFENTTVNAILGIVLILGTAPIGYLFSQFWYVGLYAIQVNKNKKYVQKLLEKKPSLKAEFYLVVLDSILYQSKQDELKEYISKRWSLYNIIGSSLTCTICGLLLGIFFRLCFTNWIIIPIKINEVIMIVLSGLFIVLFIFGMKNIRTQYDEMLTIIVNEYLSKKPNCLDTFPDYYFDVNN